MEINTTITKLKLKMVSGQLNKKNSEKGMSLIEALVSTVIISIGFIAVFQMVSYSIQSIDVSNERTKTTYLTGMVAEDLIADKFTDLSGKRLYEHIVDSTSSGGDSWEMSTCSPGTAISSSAASVFDEKKNKWNNRFSTRRIKCDPNAPTLKSFKIFDICSSDTICNYKNEDIHDKLYFGKMQVTIKAGDRTKTKFLYFQIH